MLRRLRAWLGGWVGDDEEGEEDDHDFRPSRLDASVRDAHGGQDGAGQRELVAVSQTGRELEEQSRER